MSVNSSALILPGVLLVGGPEPGGSERRRFPFLSGLLCILPISCAHAAGRLQARDADGQPSHSPLIFKIVSLFYVV